MNRVEVCGECGVPLMIGRELKWENNGVITPVESPRGRMIFYESRIIDNLFKGVEELIGVSIEHIVIESRRREVRKFFENRIPLELRGKFQYITERMDRDDPIEEVELLTYLEAMKSLNVNVIEMSRVYGYGDSRPGDMWEREEKYPWRTNIVSNPYSLPFCMAEALGSSEATDGIDQRVKSEEIGDDTYLLTTYPTRHLVALKERLRGRRYTFKPGDIEFKRCSGCGLPLGVAHYVWNPEEGTIIDPDNGRRMALYSPTSLEAVLDDLEMELGEPIPEVVIEAQRRYVKSRVGEDNWRRSGTTFQQLTALRGLGNLTEFEADERHISLTIENSCLSLVMLGMAQALYEIALNYETSTYEWEVTEEGDLNITVNA